MDYLIVQLTINLDYSTYVLQLLIIDYFTIGILRKTTSSIKKLLAFASIVKIYYNISGYCNSY